MSTTETKLLTVREAAEQRRSVRTYDAVPVAREDLQEILSTVRLAPSAWNLQPWRFVVVESPELKERLAAAAYNQPQVHSAPAVIVLYTDMADTLATLDEVIHPGMGAEQAEGMRQSVLGTFAAMSEEARESWGAQQGNIALGYLLLAAASYDYQTSPMLGFDAAAVKELLGLPAHVRIPGIVAIGKGAEQGFPHHRHPLERITRAA